MARLVGFLLLLAGIYLGVVVYTEGADRAFGGWFAQDEAAGEANAAAAPESAPQAPETAQSAGMPSRTAVTSRVRERVQGTVDERSDRISSY